MGRRPTPSDPDRLAALRALGPDGLAALLARVPALAEAADGRGPLAASTVGYPWALPRGDTARGLAHLLDTPQAIDATLSSLDRFAHQLVGLAVWHGGRLTREQALAAAGPDRAAALDAAAATLAGLLLSDQDAGWVALRPGVAEVAGVPGYPVRDTLEASTSDALARILRRLGHRKPPTRKAERVDALEAALRDPATVHAALGDLDEDALRILKILVEHGPHTVADLGLPHFAPWGRRDTPLDRLADLALVGIDPGDQVVWAWLDVIVALREGALFDDWEPDPPPVTHRPLHTAGVTLPSTPARLAALLSAWAADPAPALAAGGLGVRPVRATAKALGLPAGEVGLLAHLAIRVGLLGTAVTASSGRGRGATETLGWAPTALAEQLARLPASRRWALIVQAWRREHTLDDAAGLPERCADLVLDAARQLPRAAFLGLLTGLPDGCGLDEGDLAALAGHACPRELAPRTVAGLVAAARVLGLVPPDGPVGLTPAARVLLTGGAEAVEAALPVPRTDFFVQADLTIVAPPDLDHELAARLERYAELESAAGARTYRLTERRLTAALDAGETGEDILAFLAGHASAPLAQNVVYLVGDLQRRHGRLRAGETRAYLRCDDPGLLASAVAVRAAKLQTLAPTVAVSELGRDQLTAVLRRHGLMPRAETPDGTVLDPTAPAAEPEMVAGRELPALEPPPADQAALAARARALLDAPDPGAASGALPGIDPLDLATLERLLAGDLVEWDLAEDFDHEPDWS